MKQMKLVADSWSLLVLIGLIMWGMGPSIGTLEGHLNPVLSTAKLSNPNAFPPPAFRHKWEAQAIKLRDCTPVDQNAGLEWFLGSKNDSTEVRANAFFQDKPQDRGTGVLRWKDLVITMPTEDVLNFSHAYVYHDCGGFRWWKVKTLFYDSGERK